MFKQRKKYNPEWVIKASEYRFDEYPWLKEALSGCTEINTSNDLYVYFVNAKNPNKEKSEWQFQESITIEDTPEGDIVLDIIKPNRVGGIEFLTKVINGS